MRFFTDGTGTVGFTHANGETETILVTGDADKVVEGLNLFFGSNPQKPPLDYIEGQPETQNMSNMQILLDDFAWWFTGGEDREIKTSYNFMLEGSKDYVDHIDEMWESHQVRVIFDERR